MQETQATQVHSLGWEDPLEEEVATHSTILAGRGAWRATDQGRKESNMTEHLSTVHTSHFLQYNL